MKIVLFTEIFDCGGIDTFIVNLVANWPEKSDSFVLIANVDYPGLSIIKNELNEKICIHKYNHTSYLNPFKKVTFLNKLFYPLLKYYKLLYNIFALKKILKNKEYDFLMVVNGGYPGGDICRSASISWALFRRDKPKCIHNFHNLIIRPPFYLFFQELFIDILLINSVSQFITVSKASLNSVSNRFFLNKITNINYIYNGISNKNVIVKSNLRKELNIDESSLICLMLATYEERKGHKFLLNAFKIVNNYNPKIKLVLCGYGSVDEISKVRKYINNLNLSSVVFLYNFRNDKESLILNSDLILIASQEYESFGLTAIEAMSFKKPIVSTNVGGLPEVIGHGYGGFCVSKNDIQLFSDNILKLLYNKELYDTMAISGYNRYLNNFTSKTMSNSYSTIIHKHTF